jgi:excisionase family DNA binding protein
MGEEAMKGQMDQQGSGPQGPPESVVGVKAAAEFLGISPSNVYAWVERNQVPHYRIGRSIKFRVSELDEWLKRFHNGGTELCQ